MADLPRAYVSHRLPGRIRLRVPERRGDTGFFEAIRERLAGAANIAAVTIAPATGSILILGTGADRLTEIVGETGLLALVEPPAETTPRTGDGSRGTVIERVRQNMDAMDQWLAGTTGSRDSFRSLVYIGLIGAGFYQLARGNVFGPATTLFWRAGELIDIWRERDARMRSANGAGADQLESLG
ncbi:HMA2 domain-containing protein [Sphingomonas oleivorans]|uniref:HMA2 domain-containing protein n=1 Tax=Sphingomonas oleivorans TaxID=1735121 RepID=UPI001056F76D|nr:hypothetical protein [Sphingomonas oleivorans]